MPRIDVKPLSDTLSFGARIDGLTRATLADPDICEQVTRTFEDRGMIVFENMEPAREVQAAVSAIFGPPQDHPLKHQPKAEGDAIRGLVELDYDGTIVNANGKELIAFVHWHFDACYSNKLNRGGVLRAITIPPEDGLTGFADGIQIYKSISPRLRREAENMEIIYHPKLMMNNQRFGASENHVWTQLSQKALKVFEECETAPRAVHPAVWKRPSGESVLHVSPHQAAGIYGREDAEGDLLLEELCQEIYLKMEPYWHKWKQTDMIVWDNWRFIHSVSGNSPKYSRKMERTTIQGDYGLGRFEQDNTGQSTTDMMA